MTRELAPTGFRSRPPLSAHIVVRDDVPRPKSLREYIPRFQAKQPGRFVDAVRECIVSREDQLAARTRAVKDLLAIDLIPIEHAEPPCLIQNNRRIACQQASYDSYTITEFVQPRDKHIVRFGCVVVINPSLQQVLLHDLQEICRQNLRAVITPVE